MTTTNTTKAILTGTVAALCITGIWLAPAHAETGSCGGDRATTSALDEGDLVAMRKTQMAHDYITYAAARAARTTHTQ